MLRYVALLGVFAAFVFGQGQRSFGADIKVYDDPNILGVMVGHLNYDSAAGWSRVDWTLNGQVTELVDYTKKLRFLYCGTCQTETWTTPQPIYHAIGVAATATTANIGGVTCTLYNIANNAVTGVWLNGDTICKADLASGAHVFFTNVVAVNSGVFSNAGWNCPAQTCNKMIDFVLVFDESGSIAGADFAKERSFAQAFANSYTFGPQDTGMGLIMFSGDARVAIQMSYIRASFVNAVGVVSQRGGSTCIGCGMDLAQRELNRGGRRVTSVFVVLTDGFNNVNQAQFPGIIANVKNAGIIVFALGVGAAVDPNELKNVASTIPGVVTAYTNIPSFTALAGILDSLVQATCINIPGNPCGAGCHGFCSCGATCVCPSACDDRNKCRKGICTPGINGNGCVYNAVVCNDGDFCTNDVCDPATGCGTTPVVCTPANPCQIPSCVPATGCSYATRNCEDFNQCTDDTCHPGGANNGCDHPAIPCDKCFNITCAPINCKVNKCDNNIGACVQTNKNCDDGNACTDDTCDVATGNCVSTRKTCNDNNACTKDLCNTTTGCYNVPFTPTDCDDFSNCTIDACNPQIGCTHTNITCNDNKTCTADVCDSVQGCTYPLLDCLTIPRIKRLLGTCYQAFCNESRRGCYLDPLPGAIIDNCGVCNGNNACAVVQLPSTVPYVVAGGLLAVVIIGAIIAAVAIVSFAGKKGYDIWLAHKGGMSGAANNPLYNDGGLTGVNPTYTA